MKSKIGMKFFRTINDKIEIVRLKRVDKDRLIIKKGVSTKKVSLDYLDSFNELEGDGVMFFNIVNMAPKKEDGQDVVVCLHRKSDLDDKNGVPYCICRQNVLNMHVEPLNDTPYKFLGMSVSVDTIPKGINYADVLACYGVEYSEKLTVYMDDRVEDLLTFIENTDKFNKVLSHIHISLANTNHRGTSMTLDGLLKNNVFDYDFKRAYDIRWLKNDIIKYDKKTFELDDISRMVLEDELRVETFKTYVLPFTKEIDLSEIERSYVIVCDKINKMYIIAYDEGKYIDRKYAKNIKDKRDKLAILKHTINS